MKKGSLNARRAEYAEDVFGLADELVQHSDLHLLDLAPDLVDALTVIRRHARANRLAIR